MGILKDYKKSSVKEEEEIIPPVEDMERNDVEEMAPEGKTEDGHYDVIKDAIGECESVEKLDEIQTMIDEKRSELEGGEIVEEEE